ncbi:hypothetical protein BKA67DRAFT_583529 [Truncatella angustata]|uniref:Uncharacterized protein n=1 Tax=Truncatella angustata TaxID=152316 RepID=A0A9P8RLD5_9PEZI|nr:uncharacterized protein BKA67DRAFT_583529 [Truncatella angustata]KAH6646201.1 hypothetical protein BKA67DRAFT_583529 [Truncatella angustata]
MRKEQEQITSGNPAASHRCPLCKKSFAQESTHKRHYYYCRSKLPDTDTSRRRSCAACVRAKARCVLPVGNSLDVCVRCSERGAKCDFGTAGNREYRGGDSGSAPHAAHLRGKKSEHHGSKTSLALIRGSSRSKDSKDSLFSPTSLNSATPLGWSTEHIWDAEFSEIDTLGLESPLFGDQGIESLLYPLSEETGMIESGISSLTPSAIQFSSPSLFNHRTFTRPNQGPLVSVAIQILRSYPFMMLHKGALPPFISPLQSSWVETAVGPPQQSLLTCMGLVHLFKSRTDSNRNLIWRLIMLEQEKILSKHTEFDKWELLAAFQALLIYCLVRLQEVPVGYDGFEAALLTTVNLIFNALASLAGGIIKMQLPDDPGLSWMDWSYNEARRRTVLIFQILNTLIEMSTEASSYPTCGFVLIPLASSATLWNSNNIEEWRTEFNLCNKEQKIVGLSQTGVLTKLHLTDACVVLSSLEWEEWRAEVGEIGTLVMIVGALL